MPTILRVGPFRFAFFSNENSEPPHVHVFAAEREAKFWLQSLQLVAKDGFHSGEISGIHRILEQHQGALVEAWNDFFSIG